MSIEQIHNYYERLVLDEVVRRARELPNATQDMVADMACVFHFLRPGDGFLDVGANVGIYTILASGAAQARTLALEPIPAPF